MFGTSAVCKEQNTKYILSGEDCFVGIFSSIKTQKQSKRTAIQQAPRRCCRSTSIHYRRKSREPPPLQKSEKIR